MSDDTSFELSDTDILHERSAEGDRGFPGEWSPGDVVDDRYELLDSVGQGGMGRVYKAEDLTLHELVALKLLDVEAAQDPEVVDQFRREVKLARRVAHPNVVRTYDIGTTDRGGIPFLTMEFLQGRDLRSAMRRQGFGLAEVVSTATSVGEGLSAAHDAGVLHRDLKPENVLVGEAERVALTDFGIAGALRDGGGRETIRQRGVGTPAYMAPEQLRGDEEMDQRVDIYALGLLVFEMLTDRLPWDADDPLALAAARVEEPAPSPSEFVDGLPPELEAIVDASLERRPDDRPSRVERWLDVLDSIAPGGRPASVQVSGDESPETAPTRPLRTQDAASRPSASTSSGRDESVRVAVLPFERRGEPKPGLASGLREDLLFRLGHWDDLEIRLREVPEATSQELGVTDVRNHVDADVAIRGTVEQNADHLCLKVAVVDVATGDHVWSDIRNISEDRANDVAADVAAAVGRELTSDDPETTPAHLPTAAHNLLSEGQHILRERWRDDVEPAVERLERARERASDHCRVLSQLAVAYARLGFQHPEERDVHIERSIELARQSIDRADDSWAEPRFALAMAHFNDRSYGRAVATLRAALEREPEYAEAHELMGRILVEHGPLHRAVEHLERSLELNPYLYRAYPDLMRAYGLAGRWEEVDRLADRQIDSQFHRTSRAAVASRLLLWNERPSLERAVDAAREAIEESEFAVLLAVRETGEFADEWHVRVEEMLESMPPSRQKSVLAQGAAELAAYVGADDLVVDYLDGAIEAGVTDLVWIRNCPLFDRYRDEPAFIRREERIRGRVEALEFS